MNENQYTYQGITIPFDDAQKALILADQNVIQSLQNQANDLQGKIGALNQNIAVYSSAVSTNPHGSCYSQNMFGGWKVDQKCVDDNNAAWSAAGAQRDSFQASMDNIRNVQIPAAVKKLNDDIATIQNQIKLQIQAQIANSQAAAAAAAAANLPNQSNLNNQQALAAIAAQAAADKAKQENVVKVIGFILVAIVILGITFFIAKRVG